MVNKMALEKIAKALEIKKGETVIEIGAGSGSLTREILKITDQVRTIEKDPRLAEILKSKIQNPKSKIIEGDVREVLLEIAKKLKNYKVVGNIPYYLTGQLLRIFQQLKNSPKLIVLTIQKEVAQRITARPPKTNQLASIVNLWAKPKILFHLKPKDFYPSPKVHSSVIKLEISPEGQRLKNEESVISLIKTAFQQPRKTLLNNLSRKFPKNIVQEAFKQLNFNEKTRPQELGQELWIKLAKILPCF